MLPANSWSNSTGFTSLLQSGRSASGSSDLGRAGGGMNFRRWVAIRIATMEVAIFRITATCRGTNTSSRESTATPIQSGSTSRKVTSESFSGLPHQ
jgi:hypothetical protein